MGRLVNITCAKCDSDKVFFCIRGPLSNGNTGVSVKCNNCGELTSVEEWNEHNGMGNYNPSFKAANKMKVKVYLDDERQEPDGWIRTFTPAATIKILENCEVTDLSLDHDLGTNDTGYDVLLWLEEQLHLGNVTLPNIIIHTANPSARVKMELAVKSMQRYIG